MWSVPNRGSAAKRKVHSICRRANVEIFIDFIVSVFTLMSLACLTGSSLATWCAELKEESRPGRDWLKSAEGPEPSCKHPSGLAKKTFPVKHTTHTSKSTHTHREKHTEAHRSTQSTSKHTEAVGSWPAWSAVHWEHQVAESGPATMGPKWRTWAKAAWLGGDLIGCRFEG